MEQKKNNVGNIGDTFLNSVMESIQGQLVFTPKYQEAKNCDNLLLILAEAITVIAGTIMQKVQGDDFQTKPNHRLFLASICLLRNGLIKEIRKLLPISEASVIANRASVFACAIFSNLNNYTSEQKSLLLKDYLEIENRLDSITDFNDQVMQFFRLGRIQPDAQTATPLVIFLSREPWQFVEILGFVDSWKCLPASERFTFLNNIGK